HYPEGVEARPDEGIEGADPGSDARDDVVLPATRALSAFIVPFLVVAFVVLYLFPSDTGRLFAWTIKPSMTPMTLGAVYLGGAYFFVMAFRASQWHTIKAGFVAVGTFASLMGVATIIHWNRFNHSHVAFWLWAGLYFTTPFLVWGVWAANRRRGSRPGPGDVMLAPAARLVMGATGAVAVTAGLFLFLFPQRAIDVWPWHLSPLTSRVLGAIFMLGIAGLGVLRDARWTAARLMLQVQVFMLALILLAAARAHAEFDASNPMTWLLLGGFLGAMLCAAALSVVMERGDRRP
ncbi:MAG: hypothetical protein LC713_07475, partial [Actinobacteria bacterium]|nr:hypothetical protein [Actinomycetota bacterium]